MQKAENTPLRLLRQILCGGLLAGGIALLLSMLCAALMMSETIPLQAGGILAIAIAASAVFAAALVTVRAAGQRRLLVALGVGVVYLLQTLLLRMLCFDGTWSAVTAVAAAAGAAAAGLLGSRRKKRRK